MVEHADIKRFKQEVADYLGLEITYANSDDYENMPPLKVALKRKGFAINHGTAFCTNELKTKPFAKYLEEHCQDRDEFVVMYGFDEAEVERVDRRTIIMRSMRFKTEYPLANWTREERTIFSTEEIGIEKPITYKLFLHANCCGCLKGGKQHWYVVYCIRRDIFDMAVQTERELGRTIINGCSLESLVPVYKELISKNICPNDYEHNSKFWARVRKAIPEDPNAMPCDCSFL